MTKVQSEVFGQIASLMQEGASFCVATVVRTENATSAKAGAKAVILADGTIEGFLGGGCVQGAVRRSALTVMEQGKPRLIRVKPTDEVVTRTDIDGTELHKSGCPSGGTVDIFIEPMRPRPRLVICGATPVAVAVADLAKRMGYRITAAALADDLDAFAEPDETLVGFGLADLGIAENDFIVIATQGKRDREALAAALDSAAGYVAFVGSRRKAETLCGKLRAQGLAEGRIARLSAPAGLDIHAIEPAEIALSILGEIVMRRRSGVKDFDREQSDAADKSAGVNDGD